jgi:glycosyltransferase involved in cell wall biosynthesis
MAAPSVSVIIPAYNAAGYLERAVNSVLAQTYLPHEILIVDDGSRDTTFEVAKAMPPPARAIRKENGGPAAARNRGAKEATGEWIAFLDADDTWLPEKLERQMALATPETGIVHCLCGDSRRPPDLLTFDELWKRNSITTSSVLMQRDVFWKFGGFDEDPLLVCVEDHNLWLKVAAGAWRIRTLQENLVSYTPASGSLTQQVERFARAELANLDKLAQALHLDSEMVEQRRIGLLDEYGRELLYYRHLEPARRFLRSAMTQRFSAARLAWWSASLAPRKIWTVLDRLRGRQLHR